MEDLISADTALSMLDDIEQIISDRLNDFELKFCESIRKQIAAGRTELSPSQTRVLDKIFQRTVK